MRAHDMAAPPEGAELRATPVCFRVEAAAYVYDTLVVDASSDWAAMLVVTSTGPALFAVPEHGESQGENDDEQAARKLGRLLKQHSVRDAHVNVIPLNPTKGFSGKKSSNVDTFCRTLQDEFRISATPRVRRGIDIDAGCGQLTTAVKKAAKTR